MVVALSCQRDEVELPEPTIKSTYADVHPALWPYFNRFEKEASLRGIDIRINDLGLEGHIYEIDGEAVAGQCNFDHNQPTAVIIDHSFWKTATDKWREFVVFHELGHCVLKRGHTESVNPDGSCISIMRSGSGHCWDNYNDHTRTTYLDELFFGQ